MLLGIALVFVKIIKIAHLTWYANCALLSKHCQRVDEHDRHKILLYWNSKSAFLAILSTGCNLVNVAPQWLDIASKAETFRILDFISLFLVCKNTKHFFNEYPSVLILSYFCSYLSIIRIEEIINSLLPARAIVKYGLEFIVLKRETCW